MSRTHEHLTSKQLLLRPIHADDVDTVFTLHSDPETQRYTGAIGVLHTRDEARALLSRWEEDWTQHGMGYWAVEPRESPGQMVGIGGVRRKEFEGRLVLNLAYRLSPRTWGRGYATELAQAALRFAHEAAPDIPLVALIHPDNAPSIRVAERIGLKLERTLDYEGVPTRVYRVG
ncbi:N-acetyltransferase [Corallococcus sp. H22C18031201]|uniref:GNAT family N-acetyltransferase n=1 Tax=Citreicoccus inhibens TaxID=2849499 RepID=UPI000E741805|nr:GNAT family N-acetyltransferase [Citreicoccus inhibens]MBU8897023.1 GNAT family N-acetyltransferase [Citreicoccus inhibens]RJS19786.1 N-acetyltransferase [Corallococcus sp. H22C18031201]